MLPNALIIGAQKAGTTTVWHALDRHPDIFMSPQREIGFFSLDNVFNRGAAFYERAHFHEWDGQRICGEKTPEYLLMPDAPSRIRDVLGPDVKLIVLLRNPAERAHSGYRHSLTLGFESLMFRDALAAEPERIKRNPAAIGRFGYLARGYYGRQISNYLRHFRRDNLLVVLFEELLQDQNAAFTRIFEFLGVEPVRFSEPIYEGKSGIKPMLVDPRANTVAWRRLVIKNASEKLVSFANEYNKTVDALKPLSGAERADINRTYFVDDIRSLSSLIGRDLSGWLDGGHADPLA